MLGVYDAYLIEPLSKVLTKLGVKRGMIFHGNDGLDEISASAPTTLSEFRDGWYRTDVIKPEDFGMERCEKADIVGGTPEENAEITRDILKGVKGPKYNIVMLNAGASLYTAGKADSIKDGIRLAESQVESGAAYRKLEEFIEESNK